MLLAVLARKPKNHVVLVAKTTFIITKIVLLAILPIILFYISFT
jgi:hypothetical protein